MKSSIKSSILAIFCSVSSLAPAAAPRSSRDANPALLYWQAAAELPTLTDAQAKEMRKVADGKVDFKAELIEELNFEQTVKFLRKAVATEAPCEWGLAWEDGLEMQTPHLSKMREFSVMALVLAEARFATGETAAGVDLLVIAHHIARDAGAAPFMLSNAFQIILERRTIATAARHCMKWNAAERKNYARLMSGLPDLCPLHHAFAWELGWVSVVEKNLEGDLDKAIKMLGLGVGKKEGKGMSHEVFRQMIEIYRKKHAEGTAILKLEGEARRLAIAEFEEEIEASSEVPMNILSSLLMPSLNKMVLRGDQTEIAQAMLRSALEHGPEISKDDLAGQPFELVRKRDGLELKSEKLEFTLEFRK
jgi:hypothetical protein